MTYFLVTQLRFTRGEFRRSIEGLSAEDAIKHLQPMNCISWIIGHLANQENQYWVYLAQGKQLAPTLRQMVATGQPASTPPLDEMLSIWQAVTTEADTYLDKLDPGLMETFFEHDGKRSPENIGTLLLRNIYHYWYHTGEISSIRQMLGHKNLPEFVGDMKPVMYHQG